MEGCCEPGTKRIASVAFFALITFAPWFHNSNENREEVMTRTCTLYLVLLAFVSSSGIAQINVTRTEKLNLPRSNTWSHPQFSPTGGLIYFTNINGDGIWEYSPRTKSVRQITADAKSGLSYDISADGKSMIYRRTLYDKSGRNRNQDVVLMNLAKRTSNVVASGSDLPAPSFSDNTPVYSAKTRITGLPTTATVTNVSILGIEDTKIAVNLNGTKTLLDPLGNGSYVWPVLSPDKQQIVAYEMDRGAFVCNLRGTVVSRLGRRDAPSWSRSGKWIVYMDDKDDGHRLLSSDLFAVSPDGRNVTQLTSTASLLEMYPHCSPTENKIVCSTTDGSILVLHYEERQ
jgi:Tol biopolymer transport system component